MSAHRDEAALLIQRGDVLHLMFPDDSSTVEAIRRRIPASYRRRNGWAAAYRNYILDPAISDHAVEVLRGLGYRVEVYRLGGEPASASGALSDRAILGVSEAAPWPVVEAAYRAMCRIHHPDVSRAPDATARMKQINLAYERLQRETRGG